MRLPSPLPVAFLCLVALAGCSNGGGEDGGGTFVLAVADSLAGGSLQLDGVYLHSGEDWVSAVTT
ncbi:MAG TPA: hypothetical protein VJ874_03170, partial [Candidatus Thermoplasmatota archaeon]|nr:hypothetical protein [Candidatus Thermoplasmatota archaeon]